MSSDAEIGCAPPPPLSSPPFQRGSPARGTVAKKCREFYLRRLERTASMQKRWSMCEPSLLPLESSGNGESNADLPEVNTAEHDSKDNECEDKLAAGDKGFPLRKCRSSLDIAMDSLRKEISSLIAQDNDLFKQLLSLHDSIAELRERQRSCYSLYDDDDDDENEENLDNDEGGEDPERDREDSPSLESLSDNGDLPETSPDSTLSCRSSLSSDSVNSSSRSHVHHHNFHHHHHHRRHLVALPSNIRSRPPVGKKRHRASNAGNTDHDEPRPLVFVDKSAEICFRCQKVAPPYRRSRSITNFYYYLSEGMDSYDSGIHLQGSHSDSDHEIFV